MNTDFEFIRGTRIIENKIVPCVRVIYKNTAIAIVKTDDDAKEYVKTFGYAAEHRRQWNLGNRCNWTDASFVNIN